MIALLLFGLVASAWAAPHFGRRYGPPSPFVPDYMRQPYTHDGLSNKFGADVSNEWEEVEQKWEEVAQKWKEVGQNWADVSKQWEEVDQKWTDVYKGSKEGVEGNEYKMTIPLSGFDKKDIIVKAGEGMLTIHANRKNSHNTYSFILPTNIEVNGTWDFENSVLKVVFPLKEGVETVESGWGADERNPRQERR